MRFINQSTIITSNITINKAAARTKCKIKSYSIGFSKKKEKKKRRRRKIRKTSATQLTLALLYCIQWAYTKLKFNYNIVSISCVFFLHYIFAMCVSKWWKSFQENCNKISNKENLRVKTNLLVLNFTVPLKSQWVLGHFKSTSWSKGTCTYTHIHTYFENRIGTMSSCRIWVATEIDAWKASW